MQSQIFFVKLEKRNSMTITEKKKLIIEEIQHTNDEALVNAIEQLLKIENNETIPEWHKEIVRARVQEYREHEDVLLEWNEALKDL